MTYPLPGTFVDGSVTVPVSATNLNDYTTAITGLDTRAPIRGSFANPNGNVTGSPGNTYSSTAGGTGTTFWIKESGTGTTSGWVAVSSGGGGTTPDATTSSKGIIQLAGGLGGTAIAPTVVTDSTVQKIEVANAGTLIGTRKRLNLIQGTNVTLTVADNAANQVDVTIAAATSGSGTSYALQPCRAASTIAETWPPSGPQTRDGVAMLAGDRFLYKDSSSSGGTWIVNAGAWTRATDMASGAVVPNGVTVAILEGTKNKGSEFKITSVAAGGAPLTIGTTALAFLPPMDVVSTNGTMVTKRQQIDVIGNLVTVTDTGGAAGTTQIAVDTSLAPTTSPVQIVFIAKGDLVAGGAAGVATRFPAGGNTTMLYADNAAPTGMRWDVPPVSISDLAPVTLTDASFVDTNASLSSKFRLTLGGNRNLRAPTLMFDGQKIIWELIQDATGTRTMSFNAIFVFGSISTTLTTTANARDFLTAIYNGGTNKFYVLQFAKGY